MPSKGRKERAKSKKGRLRRPNLNVLYSKQMHSISPGQYDFRVLLVRPEEPKGYRFSSLDRNSVDLNWSEEGDALAGTLSLKRKRAGLYESPPVERGHGIRLLVKAGKKWYRLWDMKVLGTPEVDRTTGEVSCELGDSLYPMKRTKRDWKFSKREKGPKREGWRCDEIALYVCRKIGVRPGRLAKGTERFELKEKDLKEMDGLSVIRKAYAKEKALSGRRFNVRMRDGRMEVLPFKRPKRIYVLKGIERSVTFHGKSKKDTPVTEIEAKGRLKGETGKDAKLEVTVSKYSALRKFGKVTKEKSFGKVRSKEHLRTLAKRELAGELKVTRTASIELPGVPFLEKGSTLKWIIREPGWFGETTHSKHPRDKSFCYVTTASHSLNSASYSTSIEVAQDDLYFEDAKRLDEKKRDEKRKERNGGEDQN